MSASVDSPKRFTWIFSSKNFKASPQETKGRMDSNTHEAEQHYTQSLILTFSHGISIFYMTVRFPLLRWGADAHTLYVSY